MSDINSELEIIRAEIKKGTPFLAVGEWDYSKKKGEETLDIMGKKLVLKKPAAIKLFSDAAKCYNDFLSNGELDTTISDMLDTAIQVPQYEAQNLKKVKSYFGGLLKTSVIMPFNALLKINSIGSSDKVYDANIDYYFEQIWGKKYFYSIFNDFCENHFIGTFVKQFNHEFRLIMETYAYIIRNQMKADVFSVEEYSGMKPITSNFKLSEEIIELIKCNKGKIPDSDMLDLYLAAILIDPYYRNGWLFFSMIDTFGYSEEIEKIAVRFMPHLFKCWQRNLMQYIDEKHYFPFTDDKEQLYNELIQLDEEFSDDFLRVGLTKNTISQKRRKVKDKIAELEEEKREIEFEQVRQRQAELLQEERKQRAEEKKAARENRANEVKPDKASVGWVLLVLFLMGPFGIIPAIVFIKSKRPKRALCCLIPALVYLLPSLIMGTASLFV